MIVEICANSYASALAAQNAGAHRIELCSQLSLGGLTPSFGLIEKVVSQLSIDVHVLIRPRNGNFCYSENELDSMLRDIKLCKQLGCKGVVSGALTAQNLIDSAATQQLIEAAQSMEFTFHRAFDQCQEPMASLQKLIELRTTRLLSSGQQTKAINGIDLLVALKKISEGKIQIMPGSGIHLDHVLKFKTAGFEMIHFSATKEMLSKASPSPTKVSFNAPQLVSNEDLIKEMLQKLS